MYLKSGISVLLQFLLFGEEFLQEAAKRLGMMKGNQARAVLVCVYGNRAYEDTLIELKDVWLIRHDLSRQRQWQPLQNIPLCINLQREDRMKQIRKNSGVWKKGQRISGTSGKNRRAQCSGKSSLQRAGDDSFYSEAGKSMQFLRTVRGALSGGRY